jgi:hypothetical protein
VIAQQSMGLYRFENFPANYAINRLLKVRRSKTQRNASMHRYTCRFVVVGYANRSHDKTNREAFLLLATENVSAQLSFRSRTAHPGFWMND